MYSTYDSQAIASNELHCYLESQVKAITPELKPIVPTSIKVERVGFTRNASNTPYLVYRVNGRRCCTFVKRRWFFECVQLLLKLKDGVEAKIRAITSSLHFGLSLITTETRQYIPSSYVNKFFTSLNQAALTRIVPHSECNCNDLFNLCPHRIAADFRVLGTLRLNLKHLLILNQKEFNLD